MALYPLQGTFQSLQTAARTDGGNYTALTRDLRKEFFPKSDRGRGARAPPGGDGTPRTDHASGRRPSSGHLHVMDDLRLSVGLLAAAAGDLGPVPSGEPDGTGCHMSDRQLVDEVLVAVLGTDRCAVAVRDVFSVLEFDAADLS